MMVTNSQISDYKTQASAVFRVCGTGERLGIGKHDSSSIEWI